MDRGRADADRHADADRRADAPAGLVAGMLSFARPLPRTLKPTRAGMLKVKLACSSAGPCKDTLRLKRGKSVLAEAKVSLTAAQRVSVRLKVPKGARRGGKKVTLELVIAKRTVRARLR